LIKESGKIHNKIEEMLIEENLDDLKIKWACYQRPGEGQNEASYKRENR